MTDKPLCRCGHPESDHYTYILNGVETWICKSCDPMSRLPSGNYESQQDSYFWEMRIAADHPYEPKGGVISREDYEREKLSQGLIPDNTYGPSGGAHPYDFYPDPEACTEEEAGRYGEALALAAKGEWEKPNHPIGIPVATWGWGLRRWWMTKDEHAVIYGKEMEG